MRVALPFYCPLSGDRIVVTLHEKTGEEPVLIIEEYNRQGEMEFAHLCNDYEKLISVIKKIDSRL